MKSRFVLIPMILTATAAIADPLPTSSAGSQPADAHAQAAALLSREQTFGAAESAVRSRTVSAATMDAQAQAAALLRRPQTLGTPEGTARRSSAASVDAQAQAAALLSRERSI